MLLLIRETLNRGWFFPLILPLLLIGCAIRIPETDTTPPRVDFSLIGPGAGRVSNPPREEWTGPGGVQLFNLRAGQEYRFSLIVTDPGGVSYAGLQLLNDIEILELRPAAAVSISPPSSLSRVLELRGSRDSPRTLLTISGRIRLPSVETRIPALFDFVGTGRNFGGSRGRPQTTFVRVFATYQ